MQLSIKDIPVDLLNFILVTVFSLLIGLSLRILHPDRDENSQFGTDRTFTFIGIWGYILYLISPHNLTLFIAGGIVLSMLLGVNYYFKISYFKNFGLDNYCHCINHLLPGPYDLYSATYGCSY